MKALVAVMALALSRLEFLQSSTRNGSFLLLTPSLERHDPATTSRLAPAAQHPLLDVDCLGSQSYYFRHSRRVSTKWFVKVAHEDDVMATLLEIFQKF
jgi:hypothetical protein